MDGPLLAQPPIKIRRYDFYNSILALVYTA